MSYQKLSTVYDTFMDNRDPRWPQYLLQLLQQNGVMPGAAVLDMACGTGAITVPLAAAGYRVTGADLSEEMLAVAAQNARQGKVQASFLQADMREFSLLHPVQAILCACDPVNYLAPEETMDFFDCAYQALAPGGVLLFDLSTRYHLETEIGCTAFSSVTEDSAYICENWFEDGALEMNVTMFLQTEQGTYRREEEFHTLYAHEPETLERELRQAGFCDVKQCAFLEENAPGGTTARIQFTARKREE